MFQTMMEVLSGLKNSESIHSASRSFHSAPLGSPRAYCRLREIPPAALGGFHVKNPEVRLLLLKRLTLLTLHPAFLDS